jgi:hypothetical protein
LGSDQNVINLALIVQFLCPTQTELGASPQLEYWNTGVLEYWVLASGSLSLRLGEVIVGMVYLENHIEKA